MRKMAWLGTVALAMCLVPAASAEIDFPCVDDCPEPGMQSCGGEVNISGATLFLAFFQAPASTNDWIDPDCDGTDPIDQLAPEYTCASYGSDPSHWWLVQYRGVGSGNGLAEFVNYQCSGRVPVAHPADVGVINRVPWYVGGDAEPFKYPCGTSYCDYPGACCYGAGDCEWVYFEDCTGTWLGAGTVCDLGVCDTVPTGACEYNDTCEMLTEVACNGLGGTWLGAGESCDGNPCNAGTPVPPASIDIGVMDVPTGWFVIAPGGTPAPERNPGEPGYGDNPSVSWDAGRSNKLKSLGCLNTNVSNPDADTVFDTEVALVPITFIMNHHAGLGLGYDAGDPGTEGNTETSAMQTLFLTGRMPNGENFIACTRDSGSGTRNGIMSCIDLDPSWGRGDNMGPKNDDSNLDKLGPGFIPTNKGGSSRMEGTVQNAPLAIGYTGLIGGSRSAADAAAGKYEILTLKFDHSGGTEYVRPNVDNLLDNGNDNPQAFQIMGPETMASRGNPQETDPMAVTYMDNRPVADYLNNITESIAGFIALPPNETNDRPGDYLARQGFLLTAATDARPNPANPGEFIVNNDLNQTLQDFLRNYITLTVPAYDFFQTGGFPARTENPMWSMLDDDPCDCPYPADGEYSDGSAGGDGTYYNPFDGTLYTADAIVPLRSKLAGDFNGDGVRNVDDAAAMVMAYEDLAGYLGSGMAGDVNNPAIPALIGDFNADGNFDCRDIRYFADGLAMDPATGALNRWMGFYAVDMASADGNFFNTSVATGVDYVMGAAAADIAGNTPYPGAYPHGYDCLVDAMDIDYVYANFGTWPATDIDLSADMNGDLVIDQADIDKIVGDVLCTFYGDVDLDGDVDGDDLATISGNLGMAGGWAMGDIDGNGMVEQADLDMATLNECKTSICLSPTGIFGDMNCDGLVTPADIDGFVKALTGGPCGYAASAPASCSWLQADMNGDGVVSPADIDGFVQALTGGK
jgi:hypothetical protein